MGGYSFSKRIDAEGERIYEIIVPSADGRKIFYRLAVTRMKESAFVKSWKSGLTVNLEEYGTIIEARYTEE